MVFAIYKAEKQIGDLWRDKQSEFVSPLAKLTDQNARLQKALTERDKVKKQADEMKGLADGRFYWINILTDLRKVMMQAEQAEKASLTTPDNGGTNTDEGVWVEDFTPIMPEAFAAGAQTYAAGTVGGGVGMSRYGGREGGRYGGRRSSGPSMPMGAGAQGNQAVTTANEVAGLKLTCRGISRPGTANSDLAYSVQQFLTNSPSFTNAVLGDFSSDNDTNTFKFEVIVEFRHRFKL